ncbi:MAG: CD225/dispanin family protein [Muribaculaceae bacterium]|nr:CD225/dispanin family protein [Muribaculaceae bacterium]
MKYFIANNGQHEGPYSIDELRTRNVTPSTLVWNDSMKDWTPAGEVAELAALLFGGAQDPATLPNGAYTHCNTPNNVGTVNNEVCPKTWLVESILATLFCCLPLGIVGIVKASQVESRFHSGDYAGAQESSREAGKWTKLSAIIGIVVLLLYLFFVVGLGLFGLSMQ